jgi:uncharacterized protein (TIGR00730 family)
LRKKTAGKPKIEPRFYTTQTPAVDAEIKKLASAFCDPLQRRLIAEMMTSAYRFGQDQASTIDMKIVNNAVKELRYAFHIFQPYRHLRKVVVFGSARTPPGRPSYEAAKRFGRQMADSGWMVITGAASGIMRAGNEGAGTQASFGVNIRLPFEQGANPSIASDKKLITCKYFFTRKLLFLKESHATALFAGGFGTLDEGFECLTLVQTGKSDPRPIVFVDNRDGKFWKPLIKFFDERLFAQGMISPSDQALYRVVRSPEEAAEFVTGFYRVYHSMRYVGDRLVLRLRSLLPDSEIGKLSREFKEMLRPKGKIVQTGALDEESDEAELADLPRLVMPFDRRTYGRLYQLIYRINQLG